jgi:hypothetical protein
MAMMDSSLAGAGAAVDTEEGGSLGRAGGGFGGGAGSGGLVSSGAAGAGAVWGAIIGGGGGTGWGSVAQPARIRRRQKPEAREQKTEKNLASGFWPLASGF